MPQGSRCWGCFRSTVLGAVHTAQHWHPQHICQEGGKVAETMVQLWNEQSCLLERGKDRKRQRSVEDTGRNMKALPRDVISAKFSSITSQYRNHHITIQEPLCLIKEPPTHPGRSKWPHLQRSHRPAMMATIRSMISFFHRIPSSSTHQSNPAHPPPYFPISEEIPGLVALMCIFFSWSL